MHLPDESAEPSVEFGPTPIPLPLERTLVLRAATKLGTSLNELLRYLGHGQNSKPFAFEQEMGSLLADVLRTVLEIERPRLENCSVFTQGELDSLAALHTAILEYQKEWGRA